MLKLATKLRILNFKMKQEKKSAYPILEERKLYYIFIQKTIPGMYNRSLQFQGRIR